MMERVARVKADFSEVRQNTLDEKRLRDACADFEAILLSQVFQSMRANPLASEDHDPAREMVEGMMDQSVAIHISRSSRKGLADVLFEQLSPLIKTRTSGD